MLIKHYITLQEVINYEHLSKLEPVILPYRLVPDDLVLDGKQRVFQVKNCLTVMLDCETIIICHAVLV